MLNEIYNGLIDKLNIRPNGNEDEFLELLAEITSSTGNIYQLLYERRTSQFPQNDPLSNKPMITFYSLKKGDQEEFETLEELIVQQFGEKELVKPPFAGMNTQYDKVSHIPLRKVISREELYNFLDYNFQSVKILEEKPKYKLKPVLSPPHQINLIFKR